VFRRIEDALLLPNLKEPANACALGFQRKRFRIKRVDGLLPVDPVPSPQWVHGLYGRAMRSPEVGQATTTGSANFNHNCHIEFGIILLHVLRTVLLQEHLDERLHRFVLSKWDRPEFPLSAASINPNLRDLEHIPVPLTRSLDSQQIQFVILQDKPDRNRDRTPGLPADRAD
jgi:hypothetical protein